MNALVVVDLQEGPFRLGNKYDADGVVDRVNLLSEFVRAQSGQVIYIQHDGEAEEDLFPGTAGWQLLSKLIVTDDDLVIRKTQNDSFNKTNLESKLQELGVTNLLICGWATDFCVDSTVRSAVSRGFNVYIPSDAHTVSDRTHLSATKVIEHHNWLWSNLIPADNEIVVMPTAVLIGHLNLN